MHSIKRILVASGLIVFILASVFSAKAAGAVDPTFNGVVHGDLVHSSTVRVIKRQPDGKILIGGTFTEVKGFSAAGLARLNADGTVDTTFNGPDFYIVNPITEPEQFIFGGEILAIAIQPDGKILVGGNFFDGGASPRLGVRRLNADGSIDPTFFIEELVYLSKVYDIEVQADGKILLGGSFTLSSSSAAKNLARLNSDGTRDVTFTADSGDTVPKDVEIQSDGKIVAAGGFNGGSYPPFVIRVNTDGTDDTSFTPVFQGNGGIEALKIQPDGKILVAGWFTTLRNENFVRIARLNVDGTSDLSFNADVGPTNVIHHINDLAIRPDGKIVIGGDFPSVSGTPMQKIARLNANGSLDNTFTNSGTITDTAVNDVELLPDNRILAGLGNSTLVDSVLRFSADGAFDPSYVVKVTRGGTVYEILQQPDGKILVAGEFLYANGVQRRSLARFNADGSLDTSFVPYFNNVSPLQVIYAIALQPDGKILIGAFHGIVFQRLNPDGSQDMSFNPGLPPSSQIYDLTVQADGKILAGGLGMPTLSTFARYNSNGTRDTAFNPAQPNIPTSYIRRVFIQPDGRILIGGMFSEIAGENRNGIARYSADGVLDNAFIPPGNPFLPGNDIDMQADGKILIAGNNRLGRLNSDGTLDGAVVATNGAVDAVKYQPDGRILIGGNFSVVNGVPRNGIARLNANLTVDNSFTTFSNRNVNDVQLQPDGKILIGGGFGKINGVSRVSLARLLPRSTLFDYDGDGRSDVSVFRASQNRWYVFRSSDSVVAQQVFGIAGDVPVPADYDGDGTTDYAIFRPSSGDWWYLSSASGAAVYAHWGASGDLPRPSDFDGDGRTDYVVFRPSNNFWYRISTGNEATSNAAFGLAGDKPVIGDFDGDGKSDKAIFRPGTGDWWYQSSINGASLAVRWGISTDVPAPADFDGDGKTDFCVYRPSTGVWYIINSSNSSFTIRSFGISEDKPVPADYDGDGKADIAVFRPSTGVWYQMRSTQGFFAQQFGVSSDVPTPNAFAP